MNFGLQWAGDWQGNQKKIISILKTWQNMVTKFGQFKKLKCPNFVNRPNFVTIYCCVSKMKIFFLISLAILRLSRSGIHWPIIFSNKIDDSVYFQKKKKKMKRRERVPGPFSSLQFCIFCCCWKYTESSICLEKLIGQLIPDRDGRGIARDINKKKIIFETAQKMEQSWDNLQSRDISAF